MIRFPLCLRIFGIFSIFAPPSGILADIEVLPYRATGSRSRISSTSAATS